MPEGVEIAAVADKLRHVLSDTLLLGIEWSGLCATPLVTPDYPVAVTFVDAIGKELHVGLHDGFVLVFHFMLDGMFLPSTGTTPSESIVTLRFQDEGLTSDIQQWTLSDTGGLASLRVMNSIDHKKHVQEMAPPLWVPSVSICASVKPVLSCSEFVRSCHAQQTTRSLADILKQQRGRNSICSGVGKWWNWQLSVLTNINFDAPTREVFGDSCCLHTTTKASGTLHAFFTAPKLTGSMSASNKRRRVTQMIPINTTSTLSKERQCRAQTLYEAMHFMAPQLYTKLLALPSVPAIFLQYKRVRSDILRQPTWSAAAISAMRLSTSSLSLAVTTASTKPIGVGADVGVLVDASAGVCVGPDKRVSADCDNKVVDATLDVVASP